MGITEKFSQDVYTDEIRIIRQVALTQNARTLGEATDGDHFSAQTIEQPVSAHYGMRIRHIYNTPIDIPQSMMDMIPLDLLNSTSAVLDQAIAKNVNASTLAEMLATELNYYYNDGVTAVTDRVVQVTLGTDNITDAIIDMGAILDEGDTSNGVDIFSKVGRTLQIRPSVNKELKQAGNAVYDIGNWKGQDMLQVGGIDPIHKPNHHEDGYLGELDQNQVYLTSNAIWTLAESYLGLTAGALDDVYGVLSAYEGTGRALAFTNSVQVQPSPLGQGVRLMPLYRWGHANWFKSVVLLVKSSLGFIGTGSLEVIAPGSRS